MGERHVHRAVGLAAAVMFAAWPLFTTQAARAHVLITEIMYNPASSERLPVKTEWVEIYNSGSKAVNISGWYLADEDGKTKGLPDHVKIAPGQAIVLVPGKQTAERFHAAWGKGFKVCPLAKWSSWTGMHGLANSPDKTNEVLTLRSDGGGLVDRVDFEDRAPWPGDDPDGPSICLAPDSISAELNDAGAHWRRSKKGRWGARTAHKTEQFSDKDVASPGSVVVRAGADSNAAR